MARKSVTFLVLLLMLLSGCGNPANSISPVNGVCLECGHKIAVPSHFHDAGLWVNFIECPNCRTTWPVGMWLGKEPDHDEYRRMIGIANDKQMGAALVWLEKKREAQKATHKN